MLKKNNIKRIISLGDKKLKISFFLTILLGFTSSFIDLVSVALVVPFVRVFSETNRSVELSVNDYSVDLDIFDVSVLFAASVFMSAGVRALLLFAQQRVAHRYGHSVTKYIMLGYGSLSFASKQLLNRDELLSAITLKSNQLIYQLIFPIFTLSTAVFLAVLLFLMILLSGNISFFFGVLGIICAYFLIIIILKSQLSVISGAVALSSTLIIEKFKAITAGARELVVSNTLFKIIDDLVRADGRLRRSQADVQIMAGTPRYLIEMLGALCLAIFLLIGGLNSVDADSVLPFLAILGFGGQKILPVFQQAFAGYTQIQGVAVSLRDIAKIVTEINATCDVPSVSDDANLTNVSQKPLSRNLEFKNVSFSYPNGGAPFVEASFTINKGDVVVIVGPSGVGKSTLMDLILGLQEPTSGQVIIDGKIRNSTSSQPFYHQCSHVGQFPYLFKGTVKQNLNLSPMINDPEDELFLEVLEVAMCDFLGPNPLLSWIDDDGRNLSGGQRQRIGIARALFSGRSVVLFDECTSAIDTYTSDRLLENIISWRGDRTLIFITHDSSLKKHASLVLEMSKDGSLREERL